MKRLPAILLTAAAAATLFAAGNGPGIQANNDLLMIKMPGQYIRNHNDRLNLSPEQFTTLMENVHPLMHETYVAKMDEVEAVEKELRKALLQGTPLKTLEPKLKELAQLKLEATTIKLTAFEGFRKTMTKEQWKMVVGMMKGE